MLSVFMDLDPSLVVTDETAYVRALANELLRY